MVIRILKSQSLKLINQCSLYKGYGADGAGPTKMNAQGDLIFDDDAQLSQSTVSLQFTGFEVRDDFTFYRKFISYCRF